MIQISSLRKSIEPILVGKNFFRYNAKLPDKYCYFIQEYYEK